MSLDNFIKKLIDDSFYYSDYEFVTNSQLGLVKQDVRTYKMMRDHPELRKETLPMIFGRAYHVAMLEPNEFNNKVLVFDSSTRTTKGYKEFKAKYNLGDYESISMLQGDLGSGKNFENFRNGLFQVNRWKKACDQAEQIVRISEFYDGYKRRGFVFAILKFFTNKKFEFNRMLRKIKLNPTQLVDCTNTEQYMILLEKMYNYNQSDKVSLIYS